MRSLFDLCSGFVYSQVLLACTRLNLFELVSASPRSPADIAANLKLPQQSIDRLLEAAQSLELLEARANDQIGLGPLGAALLGNPAVAMMIEHHSALYADLSDPVALLRERHGATELGRYWAYSKNADDNSLDCDQTAGYSALMAASQQMIADQVLSAYSFSRHRRLLDVGGGAGAFAVAALKQNPELEAQVFDLPSVAELATQRFDTQGVAERAIAVGGNFLDDPLPEGFDAISVVRILHDHDDDAVMTLLRGVRQAIPPHGTLLIAEPMLGTPGAERVTAAYFGFYLMAMGQGRARAPDEITRMLGQAGFGRIKMHRTTAPLLVRVISARP